jgi:hypothetical protein
VVPAPISDIGPLGPVRACGELLTAELLAAGLLAVGLLPPPLLALAAGLVLPALLVLEDELLTAGAGGLSVWLVKREV